MNMITIYFDLDGVLCDFDKQCDMMDCWKVNGRPDWNKMDEIGPKFWSEMEPIETGMKLLELVQDFCKEHTGIQVGIMSAIHLKNGKDGKRDWLKKYTSIRDNIIILNNGSFKQKYAQPNSILVDDKLSNVENYKSTGNQAVLFDRTESVYELFNKIKKAIALL